MTIITKPSSVKKEEKAVPLVASNIPSPNILESGRNVVLVRRAINPNRQATTLILFLIALLVTCMGIIGGVLVYRQYAMARMQRMRFHGFCKIPFETDNIDDRTMFLANQDLIINNNDDDMVDDGAVLMKIFQPFFEQFNRVQDGLVQEAKEFEQKLMNDMSDSSDGSDEEKVNDNFLKEEFELNDEENSGESYSKINVPKLNTGRGATFLHDFKMNQTGIIDKDAKRCFFMPLDNESVLPPRDLRDLIQKLQSGYYNIDTTVLRKTMRVKMPEVTDKSLVSSRITHECENMKIYQLEKIVSGVFKRSVDADPATYTQFAGKGFDTYHITNLAELDQYEAETANTK